MRYDIEADWQLLNTCNYRCSYCFFSENVLGERLRMHATPEQWQAALARTGKTWLLHMTGGEPSVYPGFAELCARITEQHYISLNSNLTNASYVEFAARVDPSRVSFINAGFHYVERQRKNGFDAFLRNAHLLCERGFPLMISLVATPDVLAQADEIVAMLRPHGFVPFPKVLQRGYKGKRYPGAYTDAERDRFRSLAEAARAANGPLLAGFVERPTIDIASDDQFLNRLPSFGGQSCNAGVTFVKVNTDGGVNRCSNKVYLGNLLKGTLRLRTEAAPCDTGYCFYFCRKHVVQTPVQAAA